MSAVLLLSLLMTAQPVESIFTVEAIDRAVARLNLSDEKVEFLATHPRSPLPGLLPEYTAEITVEDTERRLAPEIPVYPSWKGTGVGGRQGPGFDARTGLPWWL